MDGLAWKKLKYTFNPNNPMKTPDQIEQKAREILSRYFSTGGMDNGDVAACTWTKEGMLDYTEWLLEENALTDAEGDGWVSVEDRLPEVGYKVLTLDGNEYVSIAFYRKSLPDGRHYFDSEEWHGPFCDISHWMPLPNPPKP